MIPTRLIVDKLNEAVHRDFFTDDDFENRNRAGKKDKMKVKITRLGDIKVDWKTMSPRICGRFESFPADENKCDSCNSF